MLFQDQQFGYRDAGHYYYPLHERVQAEWHEGRWPLWEPEENGGMPLLGDPTAAVLYPGKVIYALCPYKWAARLYVIAHTILAFAGMLALMRTWGTSPIGSAIGAMSYAFGGPILFQHCNIIFLVGAAWLPLGLRAVDSWLRLGRSFALLELSAVLAMEILGGDPEVAYLTGICAVGYAVGLAWIAGRRDSPPLPRLWLIAAGAAIVVGWLVLSIVLAARLPSLRPSATVRAPRAFAWMAWWPLVLAAGWGGLGLAGLLHWRRVRWRFPLAAMLTGLLGAAVLAGGLAAVQLLPVLEFTRQSGRAAVDGMHDIYPFSLEPIRVIELLWPSVFGTAFAYNREWLWVVPPIEVHSDVWVPSLYLGGLTLLLGLGAAGFRSTTEPWRGWLTAIAGVALLASFGEYASPLWWARWSPAIARAIGPHDPVGVAPIRGDGFLRDGDGSVYWAFATFFPGFKQFRYPGKLLTFAALGLAGLGSLGWDRLMTRPSRRMVFLAAAGFLVSVAALTADIALRARILSTLAGWGSGRESLFGPLDVEGAYGETRRALVQAVIVFAVGLMITTWGRRAPLLASTAALGVLAADLGIANARYVLTVPQALFESKSRVVELIEDAERRQPIDGPFRVYRMPEWTPPGWQLQASADRVREFVSWQRATIEPKYGLRYGIEYSLTSGALQLLRHEEFFRPMVKRLSPAAASAIDSQAGTEIVVYPRRAFDLWNTRYFVVPAYPGKWIEPNRSFASFLPETEAVFPPPRYFEGNGGLERREHWGKFEDFQILRNRAEHPRAWVVHRGLFRDSLDGLGRDDRQARFEEITFANDLFWRDAEKRVVNPHEVAWFDRSLMSALRPFLGQSPARAESVKIARYTPQRVDLDVSLDTPGLVILADVFYPGWRLTIDGVAAPIYQANVLMRGAAVDAGNHHLTYVYQPESFRLGGILSMVAMATLVALGVYFRRRPVISR